MEELRKKNTSELITHLAAKREELRGLRFKGAGSSMRDVKSQHNTKLEIARVLTELRARGTADNA